MTIEADDSSPERLTIGWRSSRYGIVYTLTGFIEDDGCLHISIGEQQLGSYGAYATMLVRYTNDGISVGWKAMYRRSRLLRTKSR